MKNQREKQIKAIKKQNKYKIKIKINYCLQMKQNYLKIFTTKHSIERKINYKI